jgi:hypothetical protein
MTYSYEIRYIALVLLYLLISFYFITKVFLTVSFVFYIVYPKYGNNDNDKDNCVC